ncbi:MAG TPA: acylphosphatase [Planctomycetota bacterium]|nr:acylphosphatase [Planctomycetota bacterium]
MQRRVHVFFSGTVQGVGFRYMTQNIARRFAVSGWVRNRSDGRVEILAEGAQEELKSFVRNVEEEMSGYIARKEILWDVATGEWKRFGIVPSL